MDRCWVVVALGFSNYKDSVCKVVLRFVDHLKLYLNISNNVIRLKVQNNMAGQLVLLTSGRRESNCLVDQCSNT